MKTTPAALVRRHPAAALRPLATAALVLALSGLALHAAQAQAQTPAATEPAASTVQPAPERGHAAPGPHRKGPGMHHGMHPGLHAAMAGGLPMIGPRALDDIGASAEQKTRIRDIFQAARRDLDGQRQAGQAQRQQFIALLAAPQVDATAAEALRQQQQARHDTASKRMLQAMLDAQAVLTPEQRQKLAERLQARHEQRERHRHDRHDRRGADTPRG